MLEVVTLTLGPVQTNCYLVADPSDGRGVVIDPSWEGGGIADELERRRWSLAWILFTHAHFDHIGGTAALVERSQAPTALHPADLPLWRSGGGAAAFGWSIRLGSAPSHALEAGQRVEVGTWGFEVLHLPGHTPGHVGFYDSTHANLFSGDVIFEGGIGRTDLPGASHPQLMESIRRHVLRLPDDTRIYPGHGATTTVGKERASNPFLADQPR